MKYAKPTPLLEMSGIFAGKLIEMFNCAFVLWFAASRKFFTPV